MLNVTLYEFKKRENSTKRPGDDVTHKTHQCLLKEQTSLINPVLVFDFGLLGNPAYYNYAYIEDLGNRYYFVRDWRVGDGHLWEATCEVDVLASWKVSIGDSTQYVLRSSNTFDGKIIDELYPTKQSPTLNTVTGETVWKQNITDGYFVIGVTNSENNGIGAVHYYALTQAQFNTLTNYLMSDVDWMSIVDISAELQKALINPLSYISSCLWFPTTNIFGSTVSTIKIGFWDIACGGKLVNTSATVNEYTNISIPKHPQANSRGAYLNGAPYSNYMLKFPGFGEISLDASSLSSLSTLYFTVTLDAVTGSGVLILHDGSNSAASGNIIRVVRGQVAVPIQLSQTTTDVSGTVGSLVSSGTKTIGSMLTGNIPGAIMGAASMVGNAVTKGYPAESSVGSNGSFIEYVYSPTIYATFYQLVAEDNADLGRPLCQAKVISTVPGYLVIGHADVAIAGTATENRQIKTYMEAGFFYE